MSEEEVRHHHHHHADDIFTSWGMETPSKYNKEEIEQKKIETEKEYEKSLEHSSGVLGDLFSGRQRKERQLYLLNEKEKLTKKYNADFAKKRETITTHYLFL